MKWTPEQDDILRRYYDRLPYIEIAAMVGRKYESVKKRAAKIGLTEQRKKRRCNENQKHPIPEHIRDDLMRTPKIEIVTLLKGQDINGWKDGELRFYMKCLITQLGKQINGGNI